MLDQVAKETSLRRLEPHWNYALIAASMAVSLIGAFTSTQMVCQARTTRSFSGALIWTLLGSLTFGFCSIWSLHFIAMLACELDLRIGLDVPLTILSALLAVTFTFAALSSDLLWHRYLHLIRKKHRKKGREKKRGISNSPERSAPEGHDSTDALLLAYDSESREDELSQEDINIFEQGCSSLRLRRKGSGPETVLGPFQRFPGANSKTPLVDPTVQTAVQLDSFPGRRGNRPYFAADRPVHENESVDDIESLLRTSSDDDRPRRLPATIVSDGVFESKTSYAKIAILGTGKLLYHGATCRTMCKGLLWSLAITTMHYVGILALEIPDGSIILRPFLVLLSALISWLVCTVGCILIPQIEVNFSQQLLFSVVAAAGVAAMHFTGMWATTFWSRASPAKNRGYPPNLVVAVTSIAILTCILASGLLAHSATVARNKLAETAQTRRKLWSVIVQKENAEATAAARTEFIASASHEIRTPLHQLQGYSDLLSRTPLSEEGRLLLLAIQQATRSLSMITTNVLDWSRLEKGEAVCRPTSLDIRAVCESIVNILPSKDDEVETEFMVVVAPEVPMWLLLDETYLQRILMNLLSNALKFTQSGYVLLLVELKERNLVATVKDSGFGIPEPFLPHLFEPFKQAQTRGAQRGAGLGLAIVKQLLQRMHGTISVESKYQQVGGIGPEKCGSTFTITVPVTIPPDGPKTFSSVGDNPRIVIFHDSHGRILEGLEIAWTRFGFEVVPADPTGEVSESWRFIWIDLLFLRAYPKLLRRLLRLEGQLVLLSYDSQLLFDKAVGPTPPSHIIPVKRPFLWHRIVESIASTMQSGNSHVNTSIRSVPVVDIVDSLDEGQVKAKQMPNDFTVLLVEDNKINQKLGVKMLKTLGYNVIIAEDGQEAIEKVVEYNQTIDLILMDQSMPHKDGVGATKEIREMERAGRLSGRRPIIMVTAVVDSDAQAICMSAGTDAFLPKPLALAKLEHTLRQYLV